jgi:hypothetical protein
MKIEHVKSIDILKYMKPFVTYELAHLFRLYIRPF